MGGGGQLELEFNVKFPMLRLLQFLSDLKSTKIILNIIFYLDVPFS